MSRTRNKKQNRRGSLCFAIKGEWNLESLEVLISDQEQDFLPSARLDAKTALGVMDRIREL